MCLDIAHQSTTMRFWEHLCWSLAVLGVVRCRTLYLETNELTSDEVAFMQRYGYLPEARPGEEFSFTPESLAEALRRVQAFGGLQQTGTMDPETKKLFSKKRCGVKDVFEDTVHTSRRSRRSEKQAWNKRDITYRLVNGSRTLDQQRAEEVVARSLSMWAPPSGLRFSRLDAGGGGAGKADLMLSFVAGKHEDGYPFDGQGNILAHAFPPSHGELHFDDDENWSVVDSESVDDENVTDFFAVSLHEIGHLLGLSHSDVRASVMDPYYTAGRTALHMDDILRISELYSREERSDRSTAAEAAPAPTAPPFVPGFTTADDDSEENEYPDLCMTYYDTLQVIHGKIYVFEEEWVWVLRERNRPEPGYPRRFRDLFRGLPARITQIKAIYEKTNGNVVIFFGRHFWEFDPSFRLLKRGSISKHYAIPARVPELSTVFRSNYNNKTYLIDEERFWRFDEQTGRMDRGYPKAMAAWRKVPYPVDAAIVWEGDTFFFLGPRFWRFDNQLVMAHEYYPLPVAQIWFNCEPNPEMDKYTSNDYP